MGADYSFNVKTIETHARAFLALNILAIGRVSDHFQNATTFGLVAPALIHARTKKETVTPKQIASMI